MSKVTRSLTKSLFENFTLKGWINLDRKQKQPVVRHKRLKNAQHPFLQQITGPEILVIDSVIACKFCIPEDARQRMF